MGSSMLELSRGEARRVTLVSITSMCARNWWPKNKLPSRTFWSVIEHSRRDGRRSPWCRFRPCMRCATRQIFEQPLETRKGRIIKPMHSYKFHVTSPVQAFGHGLTVYWETVCVTSKKSTIQHVKYALFSLRVETV